MTDAQKQAIQQDAEREEFETAYKKVLSLCNCPAGNKPDPFLHAPNCPTRLALIQPRIPRTAHG